MNNGLKGSVTNPEKIYGKSAYEIAVMHGFDGTEEEWLESLKVKPVKGVDYYTEEDREQIVNDVLAHIPRAEGESF